MFGCDRPPRIPATAPLNICFYKVTDKAGDCWPAFDGSNKARLYQAQLAHEARPTILFNMRNSFGDFLKEMAVEHTDYPSSIDELLNAGGIKLVFTDKDDPDNVGFVQSMSQRFLVNVKGLCVTFGIYSKVEGCFLYCRDRWVRA